MTAPPAGNSVQNAGVGELAHYILKHQSSEVSTSGDELVKVRKPYTITKQRERWTEEEHHKFLEALKLYGRAWRRIEEHIGTKTAVQIRSHAQKFFSKLEREQATGGIIAGTAQDIDIPPPRPKRKPSHPYPRKATPVPVESPMASPSALPSSAHALLSRPAFCEGTKPVEMEKVYERCRAEVKLFGQTVVVPTPTRAGVPVVEDKLQDNTDGSELLLPSQQASRMKVLSVASDVSMLVSEHDSSNGQSDNKEVRNRNGTLPCCEKPSSTHRLGEDPRSSLDLALYYSKLWESLQVTEPMYPFNMDTSLWQGYTRAVSGVWPNFAGASLNELTASVMRSMMAGSTAEPHRTDKSPAALAAATIAAASAWWALQGSVPPSFHAQRVPPATENPGRAPLPMDTQEVENMEVDTDQLPEDNDDTMASPAKADKTVHHQTFKRQGTGNESFEGGKKRIKLRSFENVDKSRLPSSSGSDDGNERVELTKQVNGDADASGNSGPSSNSSRCGTDQATVKSEESSSDKDKTEEDALTEEAAKTVKDSSLQHLHNLHMHRARKGIRSARPCRSSGSDGEQRKEVSQEGRIAFQALFSHGKLPQTFSHRFTSYREDHLRRPPYISDSSDLESVNQWHQDKIVRLESVASDSPGTSFLRENNDDETAMGSSQHPISRSRRRSGFVPYRRAAEVGSASNGASCRLEETLVNISRLVDEEVKASSCS